MVDGRSIVTGLAYELGEIEMNHRDLAGFSATCERLQLVDDPIAWGWGSVFATRRSRGQLAVASARRSLTQCGAAASDVDALILCAAEFPGITEAHATFCREMLSGLDLARAALLGVTLARCNTMLVAIGLAARLVTAGIHRTILVVASDHVVDETRRFQRHALFSDAAASCLVCTHAHTGFAVLAAESLQDPARLDVDGEIGGDLGRAVSAALEARSGVSPYVATRVLPANLFLPIVKMREQQSGFTPRQLFLDNVVRRAHCFSADPVVNLCDCAVQRRFASGETVVLASSVPGARSAVLAEAL